MRVLLFGANGMLGNAVHRYMAGCGHHVVGVIRKNTTHATVLNYVPFSEFQDKSSLIDLIRGGDFDFVINCLGAIKQVSVSFSEMIWANSVFPNVLSEICCDLGVKLLHFSTDCVFDGKDGNYLETSVCNATDIYGRSKLLGEACAVRSLVLRTSIVGRELGSSNSLLDWFLTQSGPVRGFSNAFFSGLTTLELAKVAKFCMEDFGDLTGLYHVAGPKISKYELLKNFAVVFDCDILIQKDEEFCIDRSLDSSLFQTRTGYKSRDWQEMLVELKEFYDE